MTEAECLAVLNAIGELTDTQRTSALSYLVGYNPEAAQAAVRYVSGSRYLGDYDERDEGEEDAVVDERRRESEYLLSHES